MFVDGAVQNETEHGDGRYGWNDGPQLVMQVVKGRGIQGQQSAGYVAEGTVRNSVDELFHVYDLPLCSFCKLGNT